MAIVRVHWSLTVVTCDHKFTVNNEITLVAVFRFKVCCCSYACRCHHGYCKDLVNILLTAKDKGNYNYRYSYSYL